MIPSKRGRVLIVDDDPVILDALKTSLNHYYDIVTAENAHEGMSFATPSHPIDIVVSDFKMPEKDGITFLKEFREISPDTVRILLTGSGAELDTAIDAINNGQVFRYLVKPCPIPHFKKELDVAYQTYLHDAWERAQTVY